MTASDFNLMHGVSPEDWLVADSLAGYPSDGDNNMLRIEAKRIVSAEASAAAAAAEFNATDESAFTVAEATPGEDTAAARRG